MRHSGHTKCLNTSSAGLVLLTARDSIIDINWSAFSPSAAAASNQHLAETRSESLTSLDLCFDLCRRDDSLHRHQSHHMRCAALRILCSEIMQFAYSQRLDKELRKLRLQLRVDVHKIERKTLELNVSRIYERLSSQAARTSSKPA